VTQAVDAVVACYSQPLSLMGDEFDLTASIGYSILPRDGDDPETLVKHADTALMRAKAQGPGTVREFTEEMNERVVKTLALQNRIRRALEHDEFLPFFQPQVDLASGEIVGMEALARWISPELGMVSPVEFIPVAEEYGLIDPLCDQILRAACRLNKGWQDAGLPAVPVAVNISGRQFQNARRLLHTVEAVLAETGLEPRYLELELTESSAMRDPENAIAVVGQFRDRGIACSIDDFGTGYSSLSVLKRFPIQKLKIDRSFVSDVTTDANDAAIVKAILAMAHALRLKVVAEGVETQDHLDFLRDAACDQMQGYLFSKPLAAADMEAMFRAGRRLRLAQVA
jgi:EAL domain-containing protein (putative c-di-GMP-specific phosphodiesterase class I)